jgi:glycosyltransferase involved in cell wall biosynthesis
MYDVRKMRILAEFLHRLAPFDLLHCRSYLPALVGLKLKRRRGVPFIFDMRGFWADERIEGGGWERNCAYRTVYRYFKTRERHFLNEADEIVSLTWAGKQVLSSCGLSAEAHVTVIPCCADFDAFPAITSERRMQARKALGIGADEKVLGYIGSLGGNYMLNEMIDFFCTYRMRYGDARFLFVTHVPEEVMRVEAAKHSLPDDAIIVRQATHTQVPLFMAAADHGIAFKKPLFSAKACSPTKLGEMLAMELPVIVNSGVGDVAQVVEETGAGLVIHHFDHETYAEALDHLDRLRPDMARWRSAARRWFDLRVGVERYDAIYRRVMANAKPRTREAQ